MPRGVLWRVQGAAAPVRCGRTGHGSCPAGAAGRWGRPLDNTRFTMLLTIRPQRLGQPCRVARSPSDSRSGWPTDPGPASGRPPLTPYRQARDRVRMEEDRDDRWHIPRRMPGCSAGSNGTNAHLPSSWPLTRAGRPDVRTGPRGSSPTMPLLRPIYGGATFPAVARLPWTLGGKRLPRWAKGGTGVKLRCGKQAFSRHRPLRLL